MASQPAAQQGQLIVIYPCPAGPSQASLTPNSGPNLAVFCAPSRTKPLPCPANTVTSERPPCWGGLLHRGVSFLSMCGVGMTSGHPGPCSVLRAHTQTHPQPSWPRTEGGKGPSPRHPPHSLDPISSLGSLPIHCGGLNPSCRLSPVRAVLTLGQCLGNGGGGPGEVGPAVPRLQWCCPTQTPTGLCTSPQPARDPWTHPLNHCVPQELGPGPPSPSQVAPARPSAGQGEAGLSTPLQFSYHTRQQRTKPSSKGVPSPVAPALLDLPGMSRPLSELW